MLLNKIQINTFVRSICVSKSSNQTCSNSVKNNQKTLTRQEPGRVRLGFIPDEWFTSFFNKTGVTGLGTFCFTVGTYLISKEYYVFDHEYYTGISMFLVCIIGTKYIGPHLAKVLDDEIDKYEKYWTDHRADIIKMHEDSIKHEKQLQHSMEGQLILVQAKRENVHLQREAEYRKRCMIVYRETRKRLEFCATREAAEKAQAKRCMTDWVVEQVKSSITKKIEEESISKCIEDLKLLAESYKNLELESQSDKSADKKDKDFKPPKPKKENKNLIMLKNKFCF